MFSNKFFKLLYQANNDAGGGSGTANQNSNDNNNQDNQQEQNTAPQTFATFEDYYKSLSDENKKIVDPAKEHFERVHSSVKAAREERDGFSKQLKDLHKQLDGNADAQAKVTELSKSLDDANKKADFYAEAYGQECKNPKAAYAFAVANDLFTRSGAPDWKEIKLQAPELFGQKVVRKSSAGNGSRSEQPSTGGINDWIRQQAGRGTISEG